MKHWSRVRLAVFVYLILAILSALYAASRYLSNASLSRLLLSALLVLLAGGLSLLLNRVTREPAFVDRFESEASRRQVLWGGLILLLVMGTAAALPAYRLPGPLGAYVLILRPLLAWLAALGGGTLLLLLLFPIEPRPSADWHAVLQPASLILAGFLLLWLFVRLTGLGLARREDYWYGAGVPALPLQVLAALVAGWLIHRLLQASSRRGLDALIFLLVWAASAFLWAREPLRASFFLPGPFRPGNDFYPFSDGMLFDAGGQFALIGQGLMNGQIYDRVLYPAFSAWLHALAGQRFVTVMAVQAALFAVFPAILYLLGKELGGRGLGAALAVLTALRGVNSIAAATWIDLANPKMTLTDFPTAIGVALFTLMLVRWLREPERKSPAIWAGGVLGLTLMLRVHVLLLLPAAGALALFALRFQWRRWLPGLMLLVVGMVAATTPWDLRNHAKGAPLFDVYFHSIRVVLQARYHWPPADQTLKVYPFLLPLETLKVSPPDRIDYRPDSFAEEGRDRQGKPLGSCETTPCRIANHFLHNAVTSVLFLPGSPVLDDLRTTVKESLPFWRQDWRGEGVTPLTGTLILVNLALLALGIALAWRRAGWVGWIPLGIYLAYILSNALAQTSGGRYIVPADWVIALYFLWGAGEVVNYVTDNVGVQRGSAQMPWAEQRSAPTSEMGGLLRALRALAMTS